MVFPGIGRQAWTSGSLGGGTGRTPDWDTYDATQDTAWQVMVDQTSTALSSSYDVLLNQNTIKKLSPTRAVIGMQNGSNGYVGLINCDTDDATSLEVTLSTAQRCTGELLVSGSVAMLHGTEDYGSLFPVTVGPTTLTEGSRITGLHNFVAQDSAVTYTHNITGSFILENAPFTRQFEEIQGNFYNQAVNASGALVAWPANSKSNWLMLGSVVINQESFPKHRHLFSPYHIASLDTLISSPSSALALPFNNTGFVNGESSYYNIGSVVSDGNASKGYTSVSGTATDTGQTITLGNKWSMTIPFWSARGNPTYNTSFARYVCVTWHASSHNYYPDDQAGPVAGDLERTFHFMFGQHTKDHMYYSTAHGNGTSWQGSYSGYDFNENIFRQYVSGRKTYGTDIETKLQYKMKAIQVANSVIGLYGDCNSANDIGNLLLAAATITNEEVTDRQFNTQVEGMRAANVTTDRNAISAYAPAANNIAVSTVNGSDSTSTAYDPDQTAMFALQGNYFAVVWTKSANIYISIFELTEQTSDVPTITRIIDTESLGAIPADSSSTQRLSGTAMGTGVALITCGNYYKFIKVPI